MEGCPPICDRLPRTTCTEDIEFDIYKQAREFMELSCMIMLPKQEVQAGCVHLLAAEKAGYLCIQRFCHSRISMSDASLVQVQYWVAHC
jgi:hypothetical protein